MHVFYGAGGRGDRGLNDVGFLGLLDSREQVDVSLVQWSPRDRDEAGYLLTSVLADPLRSPNELIILLTDTYDDLVLQVECQFRDRKVLHLEGADADCPKVRSVDYRAYAPAFMAGVAAVSASSTGKVAILGGGITPDVKEAAAGFLAGVKEAGGEAVAVYLSPSEDGFNNYDEGFRVATELYSRDAVDVIFVVAGATSLGVLEAAKHFDARYVIGFEYDLREDGRDVVLGSVVKNLGPQILETLKVAKAGDFDAGHLVVGLRDESALFQVSPDFESQVGTAYLDVRAMALTLELAYQESQ